MATPKTKKPDLSRFTQIDTDIDRFPKHEPETDGPLLGQILKKKSVTARDKDGNERSTRLMVIGTEHGERIFWESANLEGFFDEAPVGKEVYVAFRKRVPLDGGRSMKCYDAFIAND